MTFVLVHGGGFGATSWDRLIPLLKGRVLAVELPGRGRRAGVNISEVTIDDCAQAVIDDMASEEIEDAVLVGHSLAGVTIPRVMALAPHRLRHVVLVSAIVPEHGRSVMTTMDPAIRVAVETAIAGGIYDPGSGAALETLCNDLDEEQQQFVVGTRTKDSVRLLTEPVDLTGFDQPLPRTYIRLTLDRRVPPALQNECAARFGGEVVSLAAGHMAMVGRPHELAEILNGLVDQTG